VDITGWGSDGPWADRKAYDLLVQCETGLVSLTGTPNDVAKVGVSIADIAAGMYAFSGTLAALYRREITGEGASIEVSFELGRDAQMLDKLVAAQVDSRS